MVKAVSATQVPEALESEEFTSSRHALLIPDAKKLKDFKPPPIDIDELDGNRGLKVLMKQYPMKIRLRRINSDGNVSLNANYMLDRICYIWCTGGRA